MTCLRAVHAMLRLVLDSLENLENKALSGDDAAERVRAHAYEVLPVSLEHSYSREWKISSALAKASWARTWAQTAGAR